MIAEVFKAIRRRPNSGHISDASVGKSIQPIRLSGTNPDTLSHYNPKPDGGPLGGFDANGRSGNEWTYPDSPRGRFDVNTVNGDRLQDQTGRLLHVGIAPGRIPRGWNNRVIGKAGGGITGSVAGEISLGITSTGNAAGGSGEMMRIPHTPTPRGVGIARAYLRTVDDSASIPGVFLSDPTRH